VKHSTGATGLRSIRTGYCKRHYVARQRRAAVIRGLNPSVTGEIGRLRQPTQRYPQSLCKINLPMILFTYPRAKSVGQPIARLNALTRRLIRHSPRAISSALKEQLSLDASPHRAQRSQSPQVNSTGRRKDVSVLASLSRKSRMTAAELIFYSLRSLSISALIAQRAPVLH
jgi:hypothetical protein